LILQILYLNNFINHFSISLVETLWSFFMEFLGRVCCLLNFYLHIISIFLILNNKLLNLFFLRTPTLKLLNKRIFLRLNWIQKLQINIHCHNHLFIIFSIFNWFWKYTWIEIIIFIFHILNIFIYFLIWAIYNYLGILFLVFWIFLFSWRFTLSIGIFFTNSIKVFIWLVFIQIQEKLGFFIFLCRLIFLIYLNFRLVVKVCKLIWFV
jgi:hypothetical protein